MSDNEEKDNIEEEATAESAAEETLKESTDVQGGISDLQEGIVSGLTEDEFETEMKSSFLDYAVSTLTSRAIPDARDGMKPVQRRIIYGMWNMGVTVDSPFKKSARIVGDVMGKYHPHGDSSIYMAMARLAQPFAMRYPLVQGHGNFGSPDGDEPAAMRYTEARLSKIAGEMYRDIDKNTVHFSDTYDGDGQEPDVLPSRFPNLLCNESSGIAVGMATSIPPHNLTETINACQEIIRNPELDTDGLMQIIKGPDFPDGAIVLGKNGIRQYFETGRGTVKVRAKYELEEKDGHYDIVFTEFPYMVNKRALAKKIADLADDKVIEGIASVNDYSSDKMGTRFVVALKKNANVEVVLNHLFKYTTLQSNFAVNMLALDEGVPRVLSMRQALDIYIKFQEDIITKRTRYDLKKNSDRIHILDAFLLVADAIDETIRIIRTSETDDEVIQRLFDRFGLDEIQSKSILDMQLKKLKKLDQRKYAEEKATLEKQNVHFREILSDRKVLEQTLIDELEEIKNRYGDARRTEISDYDLDSSDEDLIPDKEVLIILTKGGYIKRIDPSEFKTQNRGGVGVKGMQTKNDDDVDILKHSRTKTDVLFFTSLGKVYRTRGYEIQEGSRTSKGIPIVNFLRLGEGEKVTSIISMDSYDEDHYLLFATEQGVVKRCSVKDFVSIHSNGKIAISLREGDKLIDVKQTDGKVLVSLASSEGKVCTFNENDVRCMGRTATGVKGIDLAPGCKVVGVVTSLEGDKIFCLSENGYGKISNGCEYRITSRGSKGVRTIKSTDKNGGLVTIKNVKGDEDIIVITDHGTIIRTSLTQVNVLSRNTIGVKIITLRDKESISSCSIAPSESDFEPVDPDNLDASRFETPEPVDPDDGLEELLKRAKEENSADEDDD